MRSLRNCFRRKPPDPIEDKDDGELVHDSTELIDFGIPNHPTIEGLLLEWGVQVAGSLGPALRNRENRRESNFMTLVLYFGRALRGIGEVHDNLLWCADFPDISPHARSLFRQCAAHLVTGVDRILSTDGITPIDDARWLMEAQYLFYDFAANPEALEHWATAAPHERPNKFGFNATRKRHENRLGLNQDQVLPARNEYRTHSTNSHPVPAHELGDGNLENLREDIWTDVGDLLQHGYSAFNAGVEYLAVIAPTLPGGGEVEDQPSLVTAHEVLAAIEQENTKAGITHTYAHHIKDDGKRVRQPDRSWAHPDGTYAEEPPPTT